MLILQRSFLPPIINSRKTDILAYLSILITPSSLIIPFSSMIFQSFPNSSSSYYTNSIGTLPFFFFLQQFHHCSIELEQNRIHEGWTAAVEGGISSLSQEWKANPASRDNDASCMEEKEEGRERRGSKRMYACTNGTRH